MSPPRHSDRFKYLSCDNTRFQTTFNQKYTPLLTVYQMKKRLLAAIRIPVFLLLISDMVVGQTYTSILSEGEFFKIGVSEQGIYKLDATFLSGTAGINLSQTPADKITLWTNGGGVLPQLTSAPRIDDLREVAMLGVGTSDGKVDAGDYFLFFAEGPDHWTFHESDNRFRKTKNIYDTENYYFVCVSSRTATVPFSRISQGEGEIAITQFDDYQSVETDRVNLLGKYRAPGSGQRWFGDEFSVTRQRDYEVNFPHIISGSEVFLTVDFAGRCDETTQVSADFNGTTYTSVVGSVPTGNVESDFARIVRINGTYNASTDLQRIRISYPQVSAVSSGWIDFIEVQAIRQLRYSGAPLMYRSIVSRTANTAEYSISGMNGNEVIWDITDPQRPVHQEYVFGAGNGTYIVSGEGVIREFIVFLPGSTYPTPNPVGQVPNQNLHGIEDADLVIIYHPDFTDAAMRLANHRLEHNGYLVEMVPIDAVMNEFAGGGQDATAIRDFARMVKSRSERFRFLLLFGDGSYDMRHINLDQSDDSFIPVFETWESLRPIYAFPSDDYFALLSDDEGNDLRGAIDVAVGRIPVSTPEEANIAVNKIINYDTNPSTHGDWRLGITYVADDEDSNQHLRSSENVSSMQRVAHPLYNQRKIYLDAYQQVSTPGGARYPDVNRAINTVMDQGLLVLNYFGHGGPGGWSQERVLGTQEIQAWTNYHKLPLFVTATCSFAPYDEPSLQSAGEQVYLHPSGGAIGLLTTVRAVYAGSNERLTSEVFERILLESGGVLAIGEAMMLAKNSNHQDTVDVNARKFALIGDPSLKLAIPQHEVVITAIDGHPVGSGSADTTRALDLVQMSGEVRNKQSGEKLSQYNGVLTATIYDKTIILKTLANDAASSVKEFETQTKVLFKGSASVKNGEFSFSFVLPQDISFKYGKGKVSLYATDGSSDAAGEYTDLVIGGSANAISDTEGPVIRIFADNENFKNGDDTGPNPTILIKLSDNSGINISGNSIGHDLQGILDEDTRTSYILNDRYVATVDNHTSGEVTLPLSGLATGMHTFRVVAWDIANNYSEEVIEFHVVDDPDNVITHLRSVPNPFQSSTSFEFDHRLGEGTIDVEVEIFTATGRLVRSLEALNVVSLGGTVRNLTWDGADFSGRKVLPGIYLYRVLAVSRPGTSAERLYESRFGKLIVMD